MRKNPLGAFGSRISLVVFASGLITSSLQAAVTWIGVNATPGVGNWSTPSNWSSNALPTAVDDIVFTGTGGKVSSSSNSTLTARDLKIESGAFTFLSLSGGGGTTRTIAVNTFSGAGLSGAVLTTENATALQWILAISGSTAFTGTVKNGDNGTVVTLVKSGTGFLSAVDASIQTGVQINTGILRISGSASGPGVPTGGIAVGTFSSAGLLEVDGKGNASTLARTLGAGAGTLRLGNIVDGDANSLAGFGAVNGSLTINLSSGAALSWTTGGFFRVNTLQLGTNGSTDRVIWSNALAITGDKTIRGGGNGSLAVDGEFSGALSMATASAVLTKDGTGTILLSGTSGTFVGRLHVTEGKLLVGGRLATATNNTTYGIRVGAGATLGGGGAITLSNNAATMFVAGTLQAGDGLANKTLTLSSNLAMEGNSILSFAIKGEDESDQIALAGGTSWTFQANQLISIVDEGISLDGGVYTLITGLTGFGAYDFSNWQVTSDAPLAGNLLYQGTTLYYQVVPEPSLFALASLGLGAGFFWMRRRKA